MKKTQITIAALLAGALFGAALPASLGGKRANAQVSLSYDHSIRGIAGQSVSASDLLEQAYGSAVGPTEKKWLAESGFFALDCIRSIPASYMELTEEGGSYTVQARPYSYIGESGRTVVFTPSTVGGTPFVRQGENYTATLNAGGMSEDSLSVSYETTVTIAAEDITEIANAAYRAGAELSRKIAEDGEEGTNFTEALANYRAAQAAYEEYLSAYAAYENAEREYRAYLSAYAEWSRKDSAYRAYLQQYDDYLAAKAAYEAYEKDLAAYYRDLQAYRDYLAALAQYEADYNAYIEGLDSPEKRTVFEQIAYMDFIEEAAYLTEGGSSRTLYSAVMGNSVSLVLDQKDALVNLNRNYREPIELADRVTHLLREDILPRYHALKSASVEEKYAFYIAYSAAARDAFSELLRALDWLYRQNTVRMAIETKDRVPQFRLLLAQLCVICNLLTDGPVANYDKIYLRGGKKYDFDENYRIDGFTPQELIRGAEIPADNGNAEPLAGGLPAMPDLPVRPDEVSPPGTMPVRPRDPVEPTAVAPAGEAPAEKPEPRAPVAVEVPDEPIPFIPTAAERALAEAYDGGELAFRGAKTDDYSFVLYATCKKYLPNVPFATLRFYPTEDGDNFYEIEAKVGETPDLSALSPYKERAGHSCVFAEWVTETDGIRTPVDFSKVRAGEKLTLYPRFEETPLRFPVVWEIDGKEVSALCEYGQSPVFDGVPQKQGKGVEFYRFVGWQAGDEFYPAGQSLPPMSESEAHYTARFEASSLADWNGGDLEVTYENGVFSADIRPADAMLIHVGALFARAAEENAEVELCASFETVRLGVDEVVRVAESGAEDILVSLSTSGSGSRLFYRFAVDLRRGGVSLSLDCTFTVRARILLEHAHVYLVDGEGEQIAFRTEGESIVFSMRAGDVFGLCTMYAVDVVPTSIARVATNARDGLARPGDTVKVTVDDFVPGRYLGSVYVVGADGTEIPVTENAFTMPEGDVIVGIIGAYHVYNITFISDGKVLRVSTYRYGDTIVAPASPSKPSDGVYSYTFERWDHAVDVCTGDDVFTAVFASEKLPAPPKHGPSKLYIMLLTAEIGGPILVVLAIAIAIAVILHRRRAKRASADANCPSVDDGTQEKPPEDEK